MKDDWVYIRHILDEIEYLQSLRENITLEELTTNRTTEHAVTRSLEIIGEVSKNIPESVKRAYPHIPWKFMTGLRDKIIHGYFAINYEIVLDVIQHKLPDLEPQIRAICAAMKPDDRRLFLRVIQSGDWFDTSAMGKYLHPFSSGTFSPVAAIHPFPSSAISRF